MSRWILSLAKVDQPYGPIYQVGWAPTREELAEFLRRERVEPYEQGGLTHWFRRDGPLAGYLPPWEVDPRCFHELPELKEHLVNAGRDYRQLFQRIPHVGESDDRPAAVSG
jgi:hypothetical protein